MRIFWITGYLFLILLTLILGVEIGKQIGARDTLYELNGIHNE